MLKEGKNNLTYLIELNSEKSSSIKITYSGLVRDQTFTQTLSRVLVHFWTVIQHFSAVHNTATFIN